jgi:hypothetical protein
MGAASEYELISAAVELILAHAAAVEDETEAWLQTHADTPSVNRLRMIGMARAITAVGSLSIFESLLQQKKGWETPFREADQMLRSNGQAALAVRFLDYRNAINVLKHGRGPSYDALLVRREVLDFEVKAADERYFHERDVAEGLRLVKVDESFVRKCSNIIADVAQALRQLSSR